MIEFRNVTKTYEGGFTALEDVNLQISDGECVFIVGGSGAGKSTLARLLIAEDKATSGSITVDGVELGGLKRSKIPYYRRKLGIVFRDFQLFPEKTVYENVAFALRVIGEHSASIRMKVNTALRMVELSEKSKCYPGELSGSEQQRVALARALANSPGVIIADEPCGNVDPVESRELLELFCRIQSRYEKTVVVLTHDRELADSFGKRMILLSRGKIAEDIAAYMPGEDLLAEVEPTQEDEPSVESIVFLSDEPVQDDAVTERENVSETAAEALAADDAASESKFAEAITEEIPVADDANEMIDNNPEEAPETVAEEATEAVAEEAPETVAEEATEAVAEEAPETVVEEAPETVAEEAPETVAEEAPEAAAEEAPETVAEEAPETVAEEAPETVVEDAPETVAEEVNEVNPAAEEPSAKAESVPAVEEAPGVLSMTISTDALESVLSELFSGRSLDEVIPSSATTDETANSKEDGV